VLNKTVSLWGGEGEYYIVGVLFPHRCLAFNPSILDLIFHPCFHYMIQIVENGNPCLASFSPLAPLPMQNEQFSRFIMLHCQSFLSRYQHPDKE
jgi:hypothetical protein